VELRARYRVKDVRDLTGGTSVAMKQTRARKDEAKRKEKKKKRDGRMRGHVSGILNRDFIELTAKFMSASLRKYRSEAGRVTPAVSRARISGSNAHNLLIVK